MKRLLLSAIGCICMLPVFAQSFTAGNIVVLQTTGTTSKAASRAVLREFTTTGSAGITVAIPFTGPTPFKTGGVYGGSEGFLTTSTDNKYLVLGGYATADSVGDITGTVSSTVPRVVGLVYPSGFYLQYDTSKVFYSANDIRGAVSDGTNFWASGASNNLIDGIDYYGPAARVALATGSAPAKAYGLRIFNNQLYYSSQKSGPLGSALGIFAVGTGTPTSGTVTVTQVITTGSTNIAQDFSFNPAGDVCYIAISLNAATGGIQKWTKSGSVWTLAYTLGTGVSNIGAYGLVVDYSGAQPIIYATTFESAGNRVIKITDAGAGSVASTLVAATAGVFNKGISFAPVASGNPLVNISVNKDTASEAGVSVVTVTANASAPVTGDQTVTLAVSGTGITAGDYTLSSTTITILSGATSGSATFTVKDDILGEGTEVATLTISAPSAGITLGMRPTQKITITDNDGNNHPTVKLDTGTTNYIDGGVLVGPVTPFKLSGVINDPTDPAKTLGVNFLMNDLETAATSLSVTVTSSNTTVVPNANLVLTGTDSAKNLKITPAAVGYSNITVSVTDGTDVTTYVINYAASIASVTPATTRWHTGMSDASDAIALDDNYYISGDDELDVLNVYARSASGLPVKSYDYTLTLGLDLSKPEVDLEAATKSPINPNKIYWLGSMSNSKAPFENRPNRDRIFATTYTGTGAATTFTAAGYTALRSSIVAWGDAYGYNFTASAAAGVDSKLPSGFAAEGMVFGPDNTTLYIGLRAPLVPTAARTKAVIAPILNFETWFNGGAPSGSPTYGAPIELDLGSRGIRDIIRLSNGSYVIIAGNPGGDPITSAIFKWTGNAGDAPIIVPSSVSGILNLEGVMPINVSGVLSTTSLQVITDQGDDVFYGDGTAAKDFNDLDYRKFRSDIVSSIDLTYPEINVTGNGVKITDGNTAISTTDSSDFGDVVYGSTVTRKFVIQNLGTATLNVSGINFTGANAGDYSLVGAPFFPVNIAASGSYTITIQFAPQNIGLRNATVNIMSNDNDEATYNFNIRGNGLCGNPDPFTVTGGGTRCSNVAALPIGLSSSSVGVNYQLYNGGMTIGSPVAGSGSNISFVPQTAAGTYTVLATHATTGCSAIMTGSVTVIVNQAPVVHTFMGGGGYCASTTGVPIGLTLTDTGISYQLYLSPSTSVGSPIVGTGDSISFGTMFTTEGVYYAIANDNHNHCTTSMSGVTVYMNPLPVVYDMTGSGSYCMADSGLHIGLSGSDAGINYQLYNGSTPVNTATPGTGLPLDFGLQTLAGDYTVIATNALTLCPQNMASVATVTVIALPGNFIVTGGGAICVSDSGAHVRLSGSESGVQYQLYIGGIPTGAPKVGTGSALDFGLQTTNGMYSAVATNTLTTCSAIMTNTVTLTVNPLPVIVYNTTGGGSYCSPGAGVHVGLNNSDHAYKYRLSRGGILVGSSLTGNGGSLDFGSIVVGGTYKVIEIDSVTGCRKRMNDSAIVNPVSSVVPDVNISTNLSTGDTACGANPVTFTALTINGGGTPVYAWRVNDVPVGSSTSTYNYTPVNADVISVRLHSNAQCAAPDTASALMIIHVITPAVPSVFIQVNPLTSIAPGKTDTFTAITTNADVSPSYQWYKNATEIPGATTMMYTSNALANHDSISVKVTTNGTCGGAATYNSVIITVYPAAVKPVILESNIMLIPNPNKGTFTITGALGTTGDQALSFVVTDMLGKVVYSSSAVVRNGLVNEQVTIDNSIANGMYLLNVHAGTENKVFHFVVGK